MTKKDQKARIVLDVLGGNEYPRGTKMATLLLDNGRIFRIEILAEHDGQFLVDQVGGVITDTDFLQKNSRGSSEGRKVLSLRNGGPK